MPVFDIVRSGEATMAALGSLLRLLSGATNERLRVFAVVAKIRLGTRSTCHKARTRRRDFKLRGSFQRLGIWHPAAGRFDPLETLPKSGESTVVSYVRGQPFDPGARANACAARCLWIGFVP